MQSNHSTFEMATNLSPEARLTTPSIVLIGVSDKKALTRVIQKLNLHNIEFSAFYESDDDMGLSSVATVPLNEEQRAVLRGYKLWNENNLTYAPSSVVRALASQEAGGQRFESVGAYSKDDTIFTNGVYGLQNDKQKERQVLCGGA